MSTPEGRDLELQLLEQLRLRCGQPMTAQAREAISELVDRLLSSPSRWSVPRRGEDYMAEVLAVRPNWQRKIKRLRAANEACALALRELSGRLSQKSPITVAACDVGPELKQWLESLATIRGQETQLHLKAYTRDLGGEA
jgi:hypothetical protein